MAFPYRHPKPHIHRDLVYEAAKAAADLIRAGYIVYSPFSHMQAIEEAGLPISTESWERINREYILWADEFWVRDIAGLEMNAPEFSTELETAFAEFKRVKYFKVALL